MASILCGNQRVAKAMVQTKVGFEVSQEPVKFEQEDRRPAPLA
jgi:hypothetical protein